MTDTPEAPQREPRTKEPWRRHSEARMLGGVCAGLARSLDIDPNLVRVALVVGTLVTGGWPALVYLGFWLFLPDEAGQKIIGSRKVSTVVVTFSVMFVSLLAVSLFGLIVLILGAGMAGGISDYQLYNNLAGVILLLFALGILVGLGLVFWKAFRRTPPTTAWTGPSVSVSDAEPAEVERIEVAPVREERVRKSKRPHSRLGRIVWSAVLVVVATIWLLDSSSAVSVGLADYLAAVTLVMGVGLLVGAWWGRARSLTWLAVPMAALLVGIMSLPDGISLQGGVGDRQWLPVSNAAGGLDSEVITQEVDYELGIGEGNLHLENLVNETTPPSRLSISANVGIGSLRVIQPTKSSCSIVVHAKVGTGQIGRGIVRTQGDPNGQFSMWEEYRVEGGSSLEKIYEFPATEPNSSCSADVVVSVGIGYLEVSDAYVP